MQLLSVRSVMEVFAEVQPLLVLLGRWESALLLAADRGRRSGAGHLE